MQAYYWDSVTHSHPRLKQPRKIYVGELTSTVYGVDG